MARRARATAAVLGRRVDRAAKMSVCSGLNKRGKEIEKGGWMDDGEGDGATGGQAGGQQAQWRTEMGRTSQVCGARPGDRVDAKGRRRQKRMAERPTESDRAGGVAHSC
jgi:hypothetical protein